MNGTPRTLPSGPVTLMQQGLLTPAEDFNGLMAQIAEEWLPLWCADTWTDFNVHDPGIMMLEQIVYASTEMPYRATLEIPRLLGNDHGEIPWDANSLYRPTDVLPMEPLTAADYVRLLYDQVPSLVYASVAAVSPGVAGCLQATIIVDPDASPEAAGSAKGRADRVLAAHCNLNERFEPTVVQPLAVFTLNVAIRFAPGATPATVLSNLYFAVKKALLPGPYFRTLAEALVDEPIEAALTGPILQRGVLEDVDLPCLWDWNEAQERAAQALLGVAGVQQIDFSFTAPLAAPTAGPLLFAPARIVGLRTAVPPDNGSNPYLQVDFLGTDSSKGAAATQQTNRLIGAGGDDPQIQFTRLLPRPTLEQPEPPGQSARAVGEYYSIQNQFPRCFNLQANALPPDTLPPVVAPVRQLKGYLLLFEQMIANYFSQLAHTADFFSNTPQASTVFPQPLKDVPDALPLFRGFSATGLVVDPALAAGYWDDQANPYLNGLQAIAEDRAQFLVRRQRVLDHLLARFNESFSGSDQATYETIDNKESLLREYPRLGRIRAAAANFAGAMAGGKSRARSGLEEKVRVLLQRDMQPPPPEFRLLNGAREAAQPADFYFVLEPIRFLPRTGGNAKSKAAAGTTASFPAGAFAQRLYHVFLNWTYRPLTPAFKDYAEAIVRANAPAHLWHRFIWLDTHPTPVSGPVAVKKFLGLMQAWIEAGYPALESVDPAGGATTPSAIDATITVANGRPAADLFAWLLAQNAEPSEVADTPT